MKLSKHKKAGFAFGTIAKDIGEHAATVGKYIKKGAEVAGKIYDVTKKISGGISVAQDWGLIGDDSALASANDMFQMVSGMKQGAGFDENLKGLRRK